MVKNTVAVNNTAAVKNTARPPDTSETTPHAFIVRIWKDATDERGQATAGHGSIDHVGSSTRLYFHKLDSILQFVRERTGVNSQPGRSWWHGLWSRFLTVFGRAR